MPKSVFLIKMFPTKKTCVTYIFHFLAEYWSYDIHSIWTSKVGKFRFEYREITAYTKRHQNNSKFGRLGVEGWLHIPPWFEVGLS